MNGTIKSIVPLAVGQDGRRHGGYGFIRDEEDRDRFFHANDLRDVTLTDLKVGQRVTFEPFPGTKANGLRAEQVRRDRG